jgi:acyl-CoA synthetase (NDP forming)
MPTLSEAHSRTLVADAEVPVSPWASAQTVEQAVGSAQALGFPVAVKLCGDAIAHKTERGTFSLVSLNCQLHQLQ